MREPKRGDTAPWFIADLLAKLATAGLILFALAHPAWSRFADKALTARAVAYPLLIAIVPALWWYRRRRRHSVARYPAVPALLLTLPFLVDLAGNAADLYDRVDWFDDACHFGNWAVLTAALGVALVRADRERPLVIAMLCTGFGATTAILWELAEFGAFVTKTPERYGLYHDTMGDLALGLLGSTLAGIACATAAHRQADLSRAPTDAAGSARSTGDR